MKIDGIGNGLDASKLYEATNGDTKTAKYILKIPDTEKTYYLASLYILTGRRLGKTKKWMEIPGVVNSWYAGMLYEATNGNFDEATDLMAIPNIGGAYNARNLYEEHNGDLDAIRKELGVVQKVVDGMDADRAMVEGEMPLPDISIFAPEFGNSWSFTGTPHYKIKFIVNNFDVFSELRNIVKYSWKISVGDTEVKSNNFQTCSQSSMAVITPISFEGHYGKKATFNIEVWPVTDESKKTVKSIEFDTPLEAPTAKTEEPAEEEEEEETLSAEEIERLFQTGKIRYAEGNRKGGKSALLKVMQADPTHILAHEKYAEILIKEENYDLALELLKECEGMFDESESWNIYFMLGEVYEKKGQDSNAIKYYELANYFDDNDDEGSLATDAIKRINEKKSAGAVTVEEESSEMDRLQELAEMIRLRREVDEREEVEEKLLEQSHILITLPSPGAYEIALRSSISATIDSGSGVPLEKLHIQVRLDGDLVPGRITRDQIHNVISFAPLSAFEAGSIYTVVLEQIVRTASGTYSKREIYGWGFTTKSGVASLPEPVRKVEEEEPVDEDTSDLRRRINEIFRSRQEKINKERGLIPEEKEVKPPQVLLALPSPGARDIAITSRISVVLDTPSGTSLDKFNINVEQLDGPPVPGRIVRDAKHNVITFEPLFPLETKSSYVVVVEQLVVTDGRYTTGDIFSWGFTTRAGVAPKPATVEAVPEAVKPEVPAEIVGDLDIDLIPTAGKPAIHPVIAAEYIGTDEEARAEAKAALEGAGVGNIDDVYLHDNTKTIYAIQAPDGEELIGVENIFPEVKDVGNIRIVFIYREGSLDIIAAPMGEILEGVSEFKPILNGVENIYIVSLDLGGNLYYISAPDGGELRGIENFDERLQYVGNVEKIYFDGNENLNSIHALNGEFLNGLGKFDERFGNVNIHHINFNEDGTYIIKDENLDEINLDQINVPAVADAQDDLDDDLTGLREDAEDEQEAVDDAVDKFTTVSDEIDEIKEKIASELNADVNVFENDDGNAFSYQQIEQYVNDNKDGYDEDELDALLAQLKEKMGVRSDVVEKVVSVQDRVVQNVVKDAEKLVRSVERHKEDALAGKYDVEYVHYDSYKRSSTDTSAKVSGVRTPSTTVRKPSKMVKGSTVWGFVIVGGIILLLLALISGGSAPAAPGPKP